MAENITKKDKRKRGCLIAIIVALVLVILLLVSATVFIDSLLGKISREDEVVVTLPQEEVDRILAETEPEDISYTGETVPEEEVTMPSQPVEVVETDDNIVNILLVGQDTYGSGRSRTDTMILCTVNKQTKTLTMTSFMRDLYVVIPGYQDQRLNVPYVLGGFSTLYETLEYNFGVEVDYGISVNFSSFKKVIDTIGGVDIELTGAEASHLNLNDNSWGLHSGMNHLNGDQALAYSRIRKLDSDFGRTNRQRKVMTAILSQAKSLPPTQLYDLVDTLIPMVHTDMSNAEIVKLAVDLVPLLTDLEIITQRVPIDGEYRSTMIKGMAVLLPDTEATREFLKETIGG